jgi:hypothetical protein
MDVVLINKRMDRPIPIICVIMFCVSIVLTLLSTYIKILILSLPFKFFLLLTFEKPPVMFFRVTSYSSSSPLASVKGK